MHFKPLILAIEFRHEMRDPLGALSRQYALDCARMPGKLGSTQIDLDVTQQPTNAIRNRINFRLRCLEKVGPVLDPIGIVVQRTLSGEAVRTISASWLTPLSSINPRAPRNDVVRVPLFGFAGSCTEKLARTRREIG
jgi:hypothetical protein